MKGCNPPGVDLTLSCPLGHFLCILELGHLREQGGAVQWPVVPPTGGLHQGREVGLGDVQPREPHHAGLTLRDLQRGGGEWGGLALPSDARPGAEFAVRDGIHLSRGRKDAVGAPGSLFGESELNSGRSGDLDKKKTHKRTRSNLQGTRSRSGSKEGETQSHERPIHSASRKCEPFLWKKTKVPQSPKTQGELGRWPQR